MLSLLHINPTPFFELDFQNASSSGGRVRERLPFLRGEVAGLPDHLDALLLTADLQGRTVTRTPHGEAWTLLGIALAEAYAELALEGRVPEPARTVAILAGDFYTVPLADRRGGTGDVRDVWRACVATFRSVVGVAGNHDLFGDTRGEREAFRREPGIHLLDDGLVETEGLRVAGVSGIPGNPRKVNRREPAEFRDRIAELVERRPDVLVLHAGPEVPEHGLRGSDDARVGMRSARDLFVVCGHVHWTDPRATLPEGLEVLNVDSRALLLCRPGLTSSQRRSDA